MYNESYIQPHHNLHVYQSYRSENYRPGWVRQYSKPVHLLIYGDSSTPGLAPVASGKPTVVASWYDLNLITW